LFKNLFHRSLDACQSLPRSLFTNRKR
jgi:hypothetical protein